MGCRAGDSDSGKIERTWSGVCSRLMKSNDDESQMGERSLKRFA